MYTRDSCIWINVISVLPEIQLLQSQKTLTTPLRLDFLGLKYFMMVDNKYFFNFIQDQKNLISFLGKMQIKRYG